MPSLARPPATTFDAAHVRPAREPLPEIPVRHALEKLLAAERLTRGSGCRPIEACSEADHPVVASVESHPLLEASGPPSRGWNMELLAGFTGVTRDPGTLTLRPEIGWAVREAPGPSDPGAAWGPEIFEELEAQSSW